MQVMSPAWRGFWILVLGLVLVACDGHTSVRGVVSGVNGHPLAGATIHLTPVDGRGPNGEARSGSDGSYYVGMMHAPSWMVMLHLTVSKSGYRTFDKEFRANKSYTCDVTLAAEAP